MRYKNNIQYIITEAPGSSMNGRIRHLLNRQLKQEGQLIGISAAIANNSMVERRKSSMDQSASVLGMHFTFDI